MQNKSLLRITHTAIFTALIMLSTILVKFSTGLGEGYIHFGDCFIYLTACVLPFPYCLIASALGGAFADILSGYAVWAIPTAIIKILIASPFMVVFKKNSTSKILNKRSTLMAIISGVISIVGYFVTECVLYSIESATLSIIGNTIQAVASGVLFVIIATTLDRINFKSQIFKGV